MRALVAASFAAISAGCGFTVHQISAERALAYYYQEGLFAKQGYEALLSSNHGALLAGAPFPDCAWRWRVQR